VPACWTNDIGPMIASLLTEDNRWTNAQRIESVWRQGHLLSAIEHSPAGFSTVDCEVSLHLGALE